MLHVTAVGATMSTRLDGDQPPWQLVGMEPRVDIVTLGVTDLAAARRFYVDGLGLEPVGEVAGEIVFFQVGLGLLALFGADELAADAEGAGARAETSGPAPMTLAHNVGSDDEVAAVLDQARAAGATVLKDAQRSAVGFVHGYFSDPSGFRWEVSHNPDLRVGPDGTVRIMPEG